MSPKRSAVRTLFLLVAAWCTVASAAEAATGPTAIAQDSHGVSYVGFATGDTLQRIDASGTVLGSLTLSRADVDGIAVGADDHVWVAYDASVVELSSAGAVLSTFPRPSPDTCARSGAGDPASYGGIAVSSSAVYVASRCGATFETYSRQGAAGSTINAGGRVRGIAYGDPQNGQAAQLYVALPEGDKVLTYRAGGLSSPSTLIHTLSLATPNGGRTPRPAGVAVDAFGQLLVSDVANHLIAFFDTNNDYSRYRDLGQPPNPGTGLGSLDTPSALALHAQDGTELAGNLFIADTGNQRVQRWNAYGYTFWATPTSAGQAPPAQAPTNLTQPEVTGTPAVGRTITCSNGTWTGTPTSYSYGYNRDGVAFATDGSASYTITAADAGHELSCYVRASNASGTSGFATSAGVRVSATGSSGPANTAPPTILGTARPGQTVSCEPGTWTGSPTYAYVFKRAGTTVSTTQTYALTVDDLGQAITCTVTATNAAGSASATSAPITPTSSGGGGDNCTGRVGVTVNRGARFVNTQAVTLRIIPPAGATSVIFDNDGGFDTATTRGLSGSCSYAHTLDVSGSERLPKTVYVRFAGGGVNETQTFTDDIVLDKTAPTVTASRVSAASSGTAVATAAGPFTLVAKRMAKVRYTLAIRAKDSSSGVATVQYASRRGARGRTVRYRPRVRVSSLGAARWVRVFDRAGNPSRWRATAARSARGR